MQKSDAELALIRRSCDIAANAHKAAMRACQPGLSEATLEAVLHYHFALEGARLPAYNSIVGGGDNACILHYTVNDQPLREGDLVLIDAGCEYEGYAADITRTFPVNGQFSPAQAELYDVVLAAQAAAIARCVAGNEFADMQHAALEVLVAGLIDLGILHGTVEDNIDQQTYRAYYMHGIGHFLGLDVHDAGVYQHKGVPTKLQPNMVLTIEPGLYIAKDSECPEQYKGIGIRIEDDVVVQHNGCEVLTSGVPKTRAQIEALMGEAYRDPLCPSQA
jgi:Xaa-Pro aminopeptidase